MILQRLLLIAIVCVMAEFGLHVIYHAITGKAWEDDPPFDYLLEIAKSVLRGGGKHEYKKSVRYDVGNVRQRGRT